MPASGRPPAGISATLNGPDVGPEPSGELINGQRPRSESEKCVQKLPVAAGELVTVDM